MGNMRRVAVMTGATLVATFALTPSAFAAFPGVPGSIAFTSLRDGNRNIYVTTGTAASEVRLTNSPADDVEPAFSADGCRVAFVSYRPSGATNGKPQIWVMGIDGSGQTNLSSSNSDNTEPAWSPDGTKIVYTSTASGVLQIWVMSANGTSQHPLFSTFSGFEDSSPAWSPDGTKVAYVSKRNFKSQIVVANADGTGVPIVVSDGHSTDVGPNWSPDGTALAFSTADANGQSQVWRMNADGTGRTQLTSGPSSSDQPAFSPDGTHIVYRSFLDATTVVTLEIDSTGGTPQSVTEATSSNEEPDWGTTCLPGAVVPEVGWPVTLPISAASAGALVFLVRRRRVVAMGRPAVPA